MKSEKGGECVKKSTGEMHFIEQCFSLYEHKMYYIAYSVLHDVQLSEDAVQEAFIRLIRSGKIFEDANSVECQRYIYTIIKNVSLNSYRKKKREAEIMYLADEEIMGQVRSEEDIDCANVEELLEGLPKKYADVIRALVIENQPVGEVAARLDISEANVRKRYERAKKMMKSRSESNGKGNVTYRAIHS